MVICFTRYVNNKSIKTLRLHYDELIGKIEEHEGKKIFDSRWLYASYSIKKILKIIGIGKFDNTEILIDINDKLPDDIALKNVVLLITYVIKDDGQFYPQIFLQR